MGFGVIHQIDSEKSFVPDDPLNDRSSMWRAPMYDKTLLSKDKLNWSKGHHAIYQDNTKLVDDPRDPELCLLHLRDVDINKFYERCLDRSKMKAANNASFHGSTDLEQVRTYFRTRMMPWQPLADSEYEGDALRVPDLWKKLINTKV